MRLTSYYSTLREVPDAPGANRLLLGAVHHAEVGTPVRYFFDGIVASNNSAGIAFSKERGPGAMFSDRFEWTPSSAGTRTLVLTDDGGGRRTQRIIVHPDSGTGSITFGATGDSITMADGSYAWIAGLRARLVSKGVTATLIGSQQNSPSPQVNVYHEGFSGRNYANFVIGTPYIYSGIVNFPAHAGLYGTPTCQIFALGTNDITAVVIGALTLSQMVGYARTLINAAIAAFPSAKRAFFLPYPYNANPAAWGGAPTLLQYRNARHDWIEAMLTEFAPELTSGALHAIPMLGAMAGTGSHLDSLHPNSAGHEHALDAVYPWVRAVAAGTA